MLTQTFVHLPGVGYATEAKWWREGVSDWPALLTRATGRQEAAVPIIQESQARLAATDHRYFARALAARDQWRAVPEFGSRIAFLDIETTGGTEGEDVTVIGLAEGVWPFGLPGAVIESNAGEAGMRCLVKGRDLDEFPAVIERCAVLVTFFGSGFDLPMLRRRFPDLVFDQLHVDLCYALKRLGFAGGLKRIEGDLDLVRSPETRGLSGWDAVRLWREYQYGSQEALDLLLRYNTEDVLNLRPLLGFAYEGLRHQALSR